MATLIARKELWQAGAGAAAIAAAGNVAIFAAAQAADVDFVVGTDGQRSTVHAGHVAVSTVVAVLIGTVVVMLARNRRRIRWLQMASLAAAALSLGGPLSMGVGTATKLTLALMHLVAASTFVAALGLVTRRAAPPIEVGLLPGDSTPGTDRSVARISGRPT